MPSPNDPNGTDTCLTCLKVSKGRLFLPKERCLRVRLLSCLLYQTNCSVLDWLDLLQVNERFTVMNQARAWKGKRSLTVELNRSYGAPLQLSIRGFNLEERSEKSSLDFIGFNALGIESLSQATSAAKICVEKSLYACVGTKVEEEDRVAAICFQAALNMASHPEVCLRSKI
jgi:hypothetical protein